MVKKQNNNTWIVYVIAIVAIVALILAIVALNKANMTGQGIFEWFKVQKEVNIELSQGGEGYCTGGEQCGEITGPSFCLQTEGCYWIPASTSSSDGGLLRNSYLENGGDVEILKHYRSYYDARGGLIYEIIDNGQGFNVGDGYGIRAEEEGGWKIYNIVTGKAASSRENCNCKWDPGMSGSGTCTNNKCQGASSGPGCQGSCTGDCSCVIVPDRGIY